MAGPVKPKTAGRVKFYGSNVGGGLVNKYKYTDVPNKLLFWDIFYVFRYAWSLPLIIRPLWPKGPAERQFDELAWGWRNAYCIAVHTILIVMQLGFLMCIPVAFFVPPWVTAVFVAAFWAVNWILCWTLNGKVTKHWSNDEYTTSKGREAHKNEQWLYINGIATGKHWLQSNLDRLALTFGRPVMGIHNSTSGIIFDLVECIVQRTFGYATRDIRYGYKQVKKALSNEKNTKVVLILHSQGGIEGGIIVDWLLQSLPQNQLYKLEVYTFGNAANHFNNPFRTADAKVKAEQEPLAAAVDAALISTEKKPAERGKPKEAGNDLPPTPPTPRSPSSPIMLSTPPASPGALAGCETDSHNPASQSGSAIGHIEHYCHSTDFVALWGALHFKGGGTPKPLNAPVFVGRAFRRKAKGNEGHLLCQHYLNAMFPLQRDGGTGKLVGCAESNEFMEEDVLVDAGGDGDDEGQQQPASPGFPNGMLGRDGARKMTRKVRDLSRLWQYRNGNSPGVKA